MTPEEISIPFAAAENSHPKQQTAQPTKAAQPAPSAPRLVQPIPGAEVLHALHAAREVFGGIDVKPGGEKKTRNAAPSCNVSCYWAG